MSSRERHLQRIGTTANEGVSTDDDAEADETAGAGVIGVIGVGSDVAAADAAAGNGVFGGGANVAGVGTDVADADAAGNGFFAGGADVTGVGADTAAAACAFALGFRRGRSGDFGSADSVGFSTYCDVVFSTNRPISP